MRNYLAVNGKIKKKTIRLIPYWHNKEFKTVFVYKTG